MSEDRHEPGPFEYIEEQLAAWELLQENSELLESLVRDANEILDRAPDAELAGMILDAACPEAGPLRNAIEEVTGQRITSGFYGVVPKQMIVQLLEQNAPGLLEHWRAGISAPDEPHLPVLVATGHGYQMGFPRLG